MKKRGDFRGHLGVAPEREREQAIFGTDSNQAICKRRLARFNPHHIRQHWI